MNPPRQTDAACREAWTEYFRNARQHEGRKATDRERAALRFGYYAGHNAASKDRSKNSLTAAVQTSHGRLPAGWEVRVVLWRTRCFVELAGPENLRLQYYADTFKEVTERVLEAVDDAIRYARDDEAAKEGGAE